MHVCVIGGGIAGSLLAWRLIQQPGIQVDVFAGTHRDLDATEASGGGVRGYESDSEQRALALTSLMELLDSRVLRDWADYHRTGSAYLQWPNQAVAAAVSEVDNALNGSAELKPAFKLGWHGTPQGAVAIVERLAGYISPASLRRHVLTEVARRATVREGNLTRPHKGYDKVVLATGAWTPELLRRNGYSDDGYRTKAIQYTIYRTGGWLPPVFVDEISGLYGRPSARGLLLGLPTQDWDVAPAYGVPAEDLEEKAAKLAAARFPELRLGPVVARRMGVDCYTSQPGLRLRPVDNRLYTFTGGSGGSVKTALAASQIAARALTSSR